MYRTEFHIHTRYSKDSILCFWLILFIAKLKKISTLVITDHNEVKGALKYKNKFKKHNIEIIVGEEIFTAKGEIIGLNLTEKISPNLSPEETIEKIKQQNGLVYVPHPYDEKRYKSVLDESSIKKNKKNIDFIEVHNGRNISKLYDIKQNEIAEKYSLKKLIGGDSHTFFELGRNYITSNEIITANNLGKVVFNEFKTSNCIKIAHICTKFARIIKIIIGGNYNELFRIINRKFKQKK